MSILSTVSSYAKVHEKLLVIAVAGAMIWGVSGKIQDWLVSRDQKRFDAATVALQAQSAANAAKAQANATLATQAATEAAAYRTLADTMAAQNAKLEQTNAALSVALSKQQAVDSTLAPPDLANRITALAKLPAGSVIPAPDVKFTLSNDGAVGIAQALENLPVLVAQLDNVQEQKKNIEGQLGAQSALVATLNTQVTGLQEEITGLHKEIADGKTASDAQIKLLKAQARRSKGKWFIIGYVSGIATSTAIKLFAL